MAPTTVADAPPVLSSVTTGLPAWLAGLLWFQGGYYLIMGAWPLVSLETFEMVTGPKTDHWLVQTVGALVAFGGTGGNAIVVTNAIAPTSMQSGLPVSATGGGSISIGPNPVKEPTLGSISVSPGGSLIQATGGGTVTITAQ